MQHEQVCNEDSGKKTDSPVGMDTAVKQFYWAIEIRKYEMAHIKFDFTVKEKNIL